MRAFRVTVPAADEDLATALLWEAGTSGLEVRPSPPDVSVFLAYFPESVDVADALRSLPTARLEPAAIPDVDWVARFRETFRAFSVGRFRVVPAWEPPPRDALVLRIDPGRAFGTGTHETTRLCLRVLEQLAADRPLGRVLDVGTGTGILAIAAARLDARRVVAADIDPESIEAVRQHARLNEVRVAVVCADGGRGFRARACDLVLANLMAPLLIERRDEISRLLAPKGRLVLSGLLLTDLADVESAYRDFLRLARPVEGEWAALVLENPR